jgi:diguanylate cyclase (GGDEF)-like protein
MPRQPAVRLRLAPLRDRSSERLPDDVLAELVGILYTAGLPVFAMGAATTVIGLLMAVRCDDRVLLGLALLSAALAAARLALIAVYRRDRDCAGTSPRSLAETERWERRYLYGSLSFALITGAILLRAVLRADPMNDILVTGLAFGYACGVVTRLAVRPMLCRLSLTLGILPAIVGFGLHVAYGSMETRAVYVTLTLLLLGFGSISFETISQSYRNIVDQILTRRDFASLAQLDPLTNLPNRLQLRDCFDAVAAALPPHELLAVHCLDLDGFKAVNDTFGHPIGDLLLQTVAARLIGAIPAQEFVARLGGDEFIVVQQGLSDPAEARALADRIVRVVSEPYSLNGHVIAVGVSIGISISPRDGRELGRLVICADAALYQAKKTGRGQVVLSGDLAVTAMS